LNSSQERYKTRKHIASSFSLKNLRYAQEIIYKALEVLGSILERHESESNPIDISTAVLHLSFDIITESSFNTNFDTQRAYDESLRLHNGDHSGDHKEPNEGLQFFHDNVLFTKECMKHTLNPFRKFFFWLPESREAEDRRQNIIRFSTRLMEAYARPSSEEREDLSIMGRIMSCQYPDEKSRIQDILVFLVGGHETSSHTISFLLLALVRHPEVLRKLQCELDALIPTASKHNSELFPTASALLNLPYLDMCIRESLRLWPVAGAGPKRILVQDVEYEGMTLPKGSIFHAHFYSMFRQPWIDRAEEFLPERWEETNPQLPHLKSMLMPFNVGTRQCIGQNLAKMELAMVTAYLTRFFDFELLSEPSTDVFLTVKAHNVVCRIKSR
jgi:cytochrome P450